MKRFTIQVMFADGGVFSAPAKDTLTQKALQSIQTVGAFQFVDSGCCVCGVLSRPDVTGLQEFAKGIHKLLQGFFETHFPAYEHANAFACLDLEADLPWQHRKELVHALAVSEGISKTELWTLGLACPAFLLSTRLFLYHAGGLFHCVVKWTAVV